MPAVDVSDFPHFAVAALELLRSLETQRVFKQSEELRSSLLRHLSTAQHQLFDTMLSRHFSVFLFLQINRRELVSLLLLSGAVGEGGVFISALESKNKGGGEGGGEEAGKKYQRGQEGRTSAHAFSVGLVLSEPREEAVKEQLGKQRPSGWR